MISKTGAPAIYWSTVFHRRVATSEHAFSYGVYVFALDLDTLPQLNTLWPFFGSDRAALLSVYSKNFLRAHSGSLREKFDQYAETQKLPRAARVTMIVSPRYLGVTFNPVTFFLCYDSAEKMMYVLAEVHNTFGETYVYPMLCGDTFDVNTHEFTFDKRFYVSPFFDVSGDYRMRVKELSSELNISVELLKDQELQFIGTLQGSAQPLNRRNIAMTLIRFPLSGMLTMLRIEAQAFKLYFKRHLVPTKKLKIAPYPLHSSAPTIFDHFRSRAIEYGRKHETSGRNDDKSNKN